jgi:hypothetical protein
MLIMASSVLVPIVLWIIAIVGKKGEQDFGIIFTFSTAISLGQGIISYISKDSPQL